MKQRIEIKLYLRGGQIIPLSMPPMDAITDEEFTKSVKDWENLFGNGMVDVSLALERWGIFIPRTDAIDAIFVELKDVE